MLSRQRDRISSSRVQNNSNNSNNSTTTQQQQAYDSSTRFLVCVSVMIHNPADGFCADRAHVGSARRRRERRLRSFLRHERMTVRMELAAALHHSSFRGAGPEMYDAPRRQRTANSRVGPAEFCELSSDDGRPTGGERPAALSEPWPQGKMERHDGIAYELVQALGAPVLQMVEQLPNVVQFFATQLSVVAETVIEVPKILLHDVPPRRSCRDTQLVEQLVEVPTPVSYSSLLQRSVEQHVDIPVPVGGGRNAGLQGTEFHYNVFFCRTHF